MQQSKGTVNVGLQEVFDSVQEMQVSDVSKATDYSLACDEKATTQLQLG